MSSQLAYNIYGNDLQYVEVALNPGEEMIAEQGAMMYVDEHIAIDAILGDGSASRLGAIGRFYRALKRSFTGESMFSSLYKNIGGQTQKVAIAAP
ncbi:MAG: AIM24 family protein, partial [Pseudomonadota bacterium]